MRNQTAYTETSFKRKVLYPGFEHCNCCLARICAAVD